MAMFEALAIFLVSLAAAGMAATINEPVRCGVSRPLFWVALGGAAAFASALSVVVASSRRAGTGFTTSYGWPKPFYFRYLSETGETTDGFELIYMVGNSAVFAGALLLVWTVCRIMIRRYA